MRPFIPRRPTPRPIPTADRERLATAGVAIESVNGVEYLVRVQDGARLWMVTTRGRDVGDLLAAVEDLDHAYASGLRRGHDRGAANLRAEIQVALGLVMAVKCSPSM